MGTDSRDGHRQREIAELFACNDAIARSGELFNEALLPQDGSETSFAEDQLLTDSDALRKLLTSEHR
jgi:hypothetical protein